MPSGDWSSFAFASGAVLVLTIPFVVLIGLSKSERDVLLRYSATLRKKIGRARDKVMFYRRQCYFRYAVWQISSLLPGELPSRQMLKRLWMGWGNQSYSGHPEYLEEVVKRAATTMDPVLECGSGLTTVLLGLFAGHRGVEVWTLEHDPEWHEHIASTLRQFDIKGVELVLAPLRSYGEFSWYDAPVDRMPQRFGMVVCDGPPQKTTPGDRYGLVPRMRDYLAGGTVILFDDVRIEGADPILSQWLHEIRASFKLFSNGPSDSYAVIIVD